jgi:hypothetical protein
VVNDAEDEPGDETLVPDSVEEMRELAECDEVLDTKEGETVELLGVKPECDAEMLNVERDTEGDTTGAPVALLFRDQL